MTDITTREERNELRRLWDAVRAIEGTTDEIPDKWQWECRGKLEILGRTYWQTQPRYSDDDTRILYESEDEARLVAAMHNALPRLLDAIDALEARNERMLRLLAGFAYQDWSEYNYAASWYDTDRKPDSWFDDLQRSFELLLRGERNWGGFWDGEIHDERIVDAMRRALEATEVEELQEATS